MHLDNIKLIRYFYLLNNYVHKLLIYNIIAIILFTYYLTYFLSYVLLVYIITCQWSPVFVNFSLPLPLIFIIILFYFGYDQFSYFFLCMQLNFFLKSFLYNFAYIPAIIPFYYLRFIRKLKSNIRQRQFMICISLKQSFILLT